MTGNSGPWRLPAAPVRMNCRLGLFPAFQVDRRPGRTALGTSGPARLERPCPATALSDVGSDSFLVLARSSRSPDELQRRSSLALQDLPGEALRSFPVPAEHGQDLAVLVDRSPKVTVLKLDRLEHFIQVPDVTESPVSPPRSPSVRRSELAAPQSNGLVGHGDASLRGRVLDVAEGKGESTIEPHGMSDDFERKAVTSIEGTPSINSRRTART